MSKYTDTPDADLDSLFSEKNDALQAIFDAENPSPADLTQARALADEVREIKGEVEARAAAAQAAADEFDALRNEFKPKGDDEGTDEGGTGDPVEPVAVEPVAEPVAAEPAPVPVAAAAKPVAPSVRTVAAKSSRPAVPDSAPSVSLVAAANVPGISTGHKFEGMSDLGDAIVAQMKGFTPPNGDGQSESLQKFGVANIAVPFDPAFQINRGTDDMEVLALAANEARLASEQGSGSLTAAGGWCSPSETLYDLAADESLEGILSVPEVQVNRGGIRYTMGPQFADFYANAGFIQTEAQAIAGTTKPCYEVTCPSFTDVRLDAVGLCIKVPILTNAAYPELVQRFTSGTMIAHQHMINANVIGRMVTSAGAARTFTGLGSSVNDSLEALTLVADQRRQTYRLPLSRTMEVVLPFWVKGMMLNDLGRRNGRETGPATEAELMAHFTARMLKVSFVYDWTVLPAGQAYPTTFPALVYPAGTFIKGVSPVINLSAVYDAASLAVNTYTGLFMEQGLLVARMQYAADLLTLPVCNAGRSGAANFTCV
jgi:hypothetical protein